MTFVPSPELAASNCLDGNEDVRALEEGAGLCQDVIGLPAKLPKDESLRPLQKHSPTAKSRGAILLKAALEALDQAGGAMTYREMLAMVPLRVQLVPSDFEVSKKSGKVRWRTLIHLYSIGFARAGFILKQSDRWELTPEGRALLAVPAEEFLDKAKQRYNDWKAAQLVTGRPDAIGGAPSAVETSGGNPAGAAPAGAAPAGAAPAGAAPAGAAPAGAAPAGAAPAGAAPAGAAPAGAAPAGAAPAGAALVSAFLADAVTSGTVTANAAPTAAALAGPTKRSLLLETVKGHARTEIESFVSTMSPYDFQDMVAALLRAMGYTISFVSGRGADGGTDILAYPDPLGARTPHIRVQVKHREAKATREEVAALRGIIRAGREIGLFVSSGGFTSEAVREARHGAVHIELMDCDGVLDKWLAHYKRMRKADRRRLRLQPVYFLASK